MDDGTRRRGVGCTWVEWQLAKGGYTWRDGRAAFAGKAVFALRDTHHGKKSLWLALTHPAVAPRNFVLHRQLRLAGNHRACIVYHYMCRLRFATWVIFHRVRHYHRDLLS